MAETPLISICCITYNHEKYIRKAIDGFLKQGTDLPIEIIIHDDASTDITQDIIREYAKKDNRIVPILREKNIKSTGVPVSPITFVKARSKYIVYCEGDDYWTDPHKLQKQVDFLENNPEYSVCFHRCKIFDQENGTFREDRCGFLFEGNDKSGVDIDIELFCKHWITQPLTMVFRRSAYDPEVVNKYKHFRDMHLIYHLLKNGKGHLLSFEGGVYREHEGGIDGKIPLKNSLDNGMQVVKELAKQNDNEHLHQKYIRRLDWNIHNYKKHGWSRKKLHQMIFERFKMSGSYKMLVKQLIK